MQRRTFLQTSAAGLATLAVASYVLHLGVITTLFVTFPYSKFAHMLYRTLAMVHEQMAGNKRQE